MAHHEVPVCQLDEKLAALEQRLRPAEWSECVVVNDKNIVLGVVRKTKWEGADGDTTAEQAMESAPLTIRPHVRRDELLAHMQDKKMLSVLVTTPDGKLVGLVRRKDLDSAMT